MSVRERSFRCFKQTPLLLLLLYLPALSFHPQGQTAGSGEKQQKPDNTIRLKVGLVQTDVMVFDRQGRFVSDLKPDQFELRVDDKEQPISFFELVTAGSPHDQEIWAKAEGKPVASTRRPSASTSDAGRTILFFLDDWHMAADNVMRSRAALAELIDTSMGVNDKAALFAASGQLGFLQQLTDNKAVLHAALEKFNFLSAGVEDSHWPPMTEGMALMIEQNDPDVIEYFVSAMRTFTWYGFTESRDELIRKIRARAGQLASTSAAIGERTLSALRNLARSAAALPGRKVIFFLSDGFVLQPKRSDIVERLRQVTDAAARAGIVIYSLDTRGLVVGLPDAKTRRAPDPMGLLAHSGYSEVMAPQDALNALASDTGGRFLKNTNALDTALITTLAEISRYYLLGWPVDPDSLPPGKYWRIHVAIKDRPDLRVRVRQGWMDLSQLISKERDKAETTKLASAADGNELLEALQSPFPLNDLPIFLHAGYIFQPGKGYVLAMSYQVDAADIEVGKETEGVRIDVMGAVGNKNGAGVGSFSESLPLPAARADQSKAANQAFTHSQTIRLDPGIYQVRVAARDPRSGRIGCAWQWIDLPPFSAGKITLSSIFLKEQEAGGKALPNLDLDALNRTQFSIQRRFSAFSPVSFFLNIYNAAVSDVQIQTKIYRGNQIILQSPPKPLSETQVSGSTGAISFSDEMPLKGLAPGSYTLEVTATDRLAHASATQRAAFRIQ